MPPEFATRLRRLLEIDRSNSELFVEAGADHYAFTDDAPGGKGFEAVFSPFDMMMLWLGLELVEMGFKQQEVVEQLRFARPLLKGALHADMRGPAADDPALFLALQGIERADRAWVAPPRPYLIDGDEVARRAKQGAIGRLVLLRVGWAAFQVQEQLALNAPRQTRSAPKRRRANKK